MEDNKKDIVVFNEDTSPIILDILTKYNLVEKDEEIMQKLSNDEELSPAIILGVVEDVVSGRISNDSLSSSIQKSFGTSSEVAQGIALDITDKLLPIARKATSEEIALLQKEEEPTEIAPEGGAFEPMPLYENPNDEEGNPPILTRPLNPLPTRPAPQEKPMEPAPATKPLPEEPTEIKKGPRTSDSYREPLE